MLLNEPPHTKTLIYNPESKTFRILEQDSLKRIQSPSFSRATTNRSFIPNRFLIQGTLEISSALLSSSDLKEAVETAAYEELGLDEATEYEFIFSAPQKASADRIPIKVYAVDKKRASELFSDAIEEIVCFDELLPFPVLFKSLYDQRVLPSGESHAFLYLSDEDCVFVFCRNGSPLFSKSLPTFSLKRIHENYKEVTEYDKFIKTFTKEGTRSPVPSLQEYFIKTFNNLFIQINDILVFLNRAYDTGKPDHLYIASAYGPVSGMNEFANTYLGLSSSPMVFHTRVKSDDWFIDPPDLLLALGADPELSFPLYPRPEVFFRRPAGKALAVAAAATILGLSVPAFYFGEALFLKSANAKLETELSSLTREAAKYRGILAGLLREKKTEQKELAKVKSFYSEKYRRLKTIEKMKNGYRFRWADLYRFAELLKKHSVYLSSLEYKNGVYRMKLVSDDDRKMTELVKELTSELSPSFIDLKRLSEKDGVYLSLLEVKP